MKQAEEVSHMELIEQVSQLCEVDRITLQELQHEILTIDNEWTRVYSEYHSGGWHTLSLMSSTGQPTDTTLKDCVPVETTLLAKLPKTRAYLRSLGLRYMWARLAKIEPNSFVWEHRDYQELNSERRVRLHIPIITNPSAALIIAGKRIHLSEGYVWKLNPIHHHGAANFGHESRIHILLDCYSNQPLDEMLNSEKLDHARVEELPTLPSDVLSRATEMSLTLTRLGYNISAERLLLKMFHSYRLEAGATYDLVRRMYETVGDQERRQFWSDNKVKFLNLKNDESALSLQGKAS